MRFVIGLLLGCATMLAGALARDHWLEQAADVAAPPVAASPMAPLLPDPPAAAAPAVAAVEVSTAMPSATAVEPETARQPATAADLASVDAPATLSDAPLWTSVTAAPAAPEPAPPGDPAPAASVPDAEDPAVAWKPFHSEVSARGFARTLSTRLGHPFEVRRDGPARYQVVYRYDSSSQRDLLRQQVAALTGYLAP